MPVTKAFADAWFERIIQRLTDASLHLSPADNVADDDDIQRFSSPYGDVLVTIDAPLEDNEDFVTRLSGRSSTSGDDQRGLAFGIDTDSDSDADSGGSNHARSGSESEDDMSSIAADDGSVQPVTWTLLNVVTVGSAVVLPLDRNLHEHIYTYVHETNALYQGKFIIEQPIVESRGLRSVRRVIFFPWKQRLHQSSSATLSSSRKRRHQNLDSPSTIVLEETSDDATGGAIDHPPMETDDGSSAGPAKRTRLNENGGDSDTSPEAIVVDDGSGET